MDDSPQHSSSNNGQQIVKPNEEQQSITPNVESRSVTLCDEQQNSIPENSTTHNESQNIIPNDDQQNIIQNDVISNIVSTDVSMIDDLSENDKDLENLLSLPSLDPHYVEIIINGLWENVEEFELHPNTVNRQEFIRIMGRLMDVNNLLPLPRSLDELRLMAQQVVEKKTPEEIEELLQLFLT